MIFYLIFDMASVATELQSPLACQMARFTRLAHLLYRRYINVIGGTTQIASTDNFTT